MQLYVSIEVCLSLLIGCNATQRNCGEDVSSAAVNEWTGRVATYIEYGNVVSIGHHSSVFLHINMS